MIEYTKDKPLRVITLFSGYDAQLLSLERLKRAYPDFDYVCVGWSEIDKYACIAHDALFPQYKGLNLGDVCKIDWEKAPDCDLLTYSSPCFPKGTLVLTDSGYKPIEDVVSGDKVLTHTNSYQKVIKPMCRKHHGMVFNLTSSIFNDLTCTDNHPLYVRRMWRKGHERLRTFDAPEWLNPKQILARIMSDEKPKTRRYYIGYAINTESELPQWNGSIDNRWGHHKEVNHLAPLFDNPNFWYLMGRWVGDGWKRTNETGNCIIICCGGRYEKELTNALDNVGWHYSKHQERTVSKYFISMNELYSFVERYGYYAYGKHLDAETLNLPIPLLKRFLDGVLESDGSYSEGYYKISSVSPVLIYGLGQCIAKVYHRPFSIYKTLRPKKTMIEGRLVNQRDSWTITFKKETSIQDQSFYEDGYVWSPLNKIEMAHADITVYNMEVENDNSYTANGAIVHNCQDFSSAGKQAGGEKGSGTRSSLLWECERAIRIKRPRYLLFENVAAIISSKFIKLFNRWQRTLEELGYTNFVKLMNAKDYGVPQSRLRCFMVSILDANARYYFPEPFPLKKRLKDILEDEVAESYYLSDERVAGLIQSTLKEKAANRGFEFKPKSVDDETANTLTGGCTTRKTDNFIVCGAIRGRKDEPTDDRTTQRLETNSPDVSNTITSVQKDCVIVLGGKQDVANTVTCHYAKEKTSDLIRDTFGGGSFIMEAKKENKVEPMALAHPLSHKLEQPKPKDISPTLRATDYKCPTCAMLPNVDGWRIRKLTPIETGRLMGLEDAEIQKMYDAGIPKTQLYKLHGNSIVVNVLKEIFRKMFIETRNENMQLELF